MISSSELNTQDSEIFKGIALFTPGGDLVYCIDPRKQGRWHMQLCAVLQEMLGLPEPPHFLVPCYAATIDRWLDPRTQQVKTFAEACPRVLRYQSLLNALFGVGDLLWSESPCPEEVCDPLVVEAYRQQFPQLWEDHNLVVRFEKVEPLLHFQDSKNSTLSWSPVSQGQEAQGYVLRLFVSGNNIATAKILHNLHQLLEKVLQQPYTLKVVDIHKHPEQAEADQIAATPTLVKVWPQPVRRIVGDLDNVSKVLRVLAANDAPNDIGS